MHLTRFELNPARRATRHLLASPHRLHGAVMKAFPAAHREPTEDGRVLWRLDQTPKQTLLYIVSPHRPDLTHLVEETGWPATSTWDTRPYGPLLDQLAAGQEWAFRLTANPTRSVRRTSDVDTKRYGHLTVTQQTDWLLGRVERLGFSIPPAVENEPDVTVRGRDRRRFARQGTTVTLTLATYEGRLRVADPALFRRTLTHGIGSAKGYGCGLLTLARVRPT
ncbi:type I-E CRISPR-associated protein Cas6/Cse3/CasE [Actinoalloteichus sp. AHMU CJ021]|uniref:type I-E CRISPR-associated protein Cas6/Cse3/CasE n=1 Tax=Actinoalloteichus sp. AHMU CJ021 TaxID=2072503 RepID=UPI000CA0783E|nr:type I-E CRISPR-associated protein Cas6/Cse3/CasE [Actinoalloteichus sp. AHMU CJ021]